MAHSTKSSRDLSLHDRLSRLTYHQAAKLLGEGGEKLIQKGGGWDIDINEQVVLNSETFRLTLPTLSEGNLSSGPAVVTIRRAAEERDYLRWECSACDGACEHIGA